MGIMGKNKFLIGCVILACLMVSGCSCLDLRIDKDGKEHTKLTDILKKSGELIGAVSSCVPGYGVVSGGALLLLSGVANGILSIVVRRRGREARDEQGV